MNFRIIPHKLCHQDHHVVHHSAAGCLYALQQQLIGHFLAVLPVIGSPEDLAHPLFLIDHLALRLQHPVGDHDEVVAFIKQPPLRFHFHMVEDAYRQGMVLHNLDVAPPLDETGGRADFEKLKLTCFQIDDDKIDGGKAVCHAAGQRT